MDSNKNLNVIDNLQSIDTFNPLSANQGKILKDTQDKIIKKSTWMNTMSGGGNIYWSYDNKLSTSKRLIFIPTNKTSGYINITLDNLVVPNWGIAYIDLTDAQLEQSNLSFTQDDVTVEIHNTYTITDKPNRIIIGYHNGDNHKFVFSNGVAIKKGLSTLNIQNIEYPLEMQYIRFHSEGSTANGGNHICEIKVYDEFGNEIEDWDFESGFISSDKEDARNDNIIIHDYTGVSSDAVIKLGSVYKVGGIRLWRYGKDYRTYHNTRIECSLDNSDYMILQDSRITGEYIESADGCFVGSPYIGGAKYKPVIDNWTYSGGKNITTTVSTLFNTKQFQVPGGRKLEVDLSLPLRSDLDGWGGAYINLNVRLVRGKKKDGTVVDNLYKNGGNCGYDGNTMENGAKSIATYNKNYFIDIHKLFDLDKRFTCWVLFEVTAKSYNGTVKLNYSHDINRTANGLDSRGPLATDVSNQNYTNIIVKQI